MVLSYSLYTPRYANATSQITPTVPLTYQNLLVPNAQGVALANMSLYHGDQTTAPPASGGAETTSRSLNQCMWSTYPSGISCDQCFPTFDDLVVHLAREHDVQGPQDRKLVCRWQTPGGPCGNLYRRDAFRRHIAKHLCISYPCIVAGCDKSFSRMDTMRLHVKRKHAMG